MGQAWADGEPSGRAGAGLGGEEGWRVCQEKWGSERDGGSGAAPGLVWRRGRKAALGG